MTAETTAARPRSTSGAVVAAGVVAAIVVSVALNAAVAAIAHAAGASDDFNPLKFASYTSLTVIGVLAAAAVWAVIRSRASDPRKVLGVLVPVVVVLSLIPDLMVGVQDSQAGTSWGAVVALMVMHFVVAAVTVPILQRVLPLPARSAV